MEPLDAKAAKKAKRERKEAKRSKKSARKEAKRAAKRARREARSSSSSGSSDEDGGGGGTSSLPAAARWKPPLPAAPAAAGPSVSALEQELASLRQAALKRRIGGGGVSLGAVSRSGAILPLPQSAAEAEMRQLRAARFEETEAQRALAAAAARPAPKLAAGEVLRGESQALEKSYLRLTAMPRADQVRPLRVLREAFAMVGQRWQAERDYGYACEQLKAIRQDLTVQHHGQSGVLAMHSGPPRAHQTASQGLGLPSALVRRGPAPLIPPGGRAFQARGRPSHHFHCV